MSLIFRMWVTEDFLQILDGIRHREPSIPNRAEMVRRLLEEAIEARKKQRKAA